MAAAAFRAPHGGQERHRSVLVHAELPARTLLFKQVEMNAVSATAGAQHRSRPEMRIFTGNVKRIHLQLFGKIFHVFRSDAWAGCRTRFAANPRAQLCDAPGYGVGQPVEPFHAASSGSLSS